MHLNPSESEQIAQRVIDACITGTLFTARCVEDDSHPVIVVWSSGAVEQLAALLQTEIESLP